MEKATKDRAIVVALIGAAAAIATPIVAAQFSPDPPPPPAPPQQTLSDTTAVPTAAPTQVPPQPPPVPSDLPHDWGTIEQVGNGVTLVSTTTCDGVGTVGSGFLVGDTLVATAGHVVAGASSVTVGPSGSVSEAEIIGYSEQADLALLRIPASTEGHVFSWADEPLSVGQAVAVLGYPLGAGFTSTLGSVSSLHPRAEGFSETARYIQTDAAVNPGSSGGPLITMDGDVAGVVQSGVEHTGESRPVEGVNFALSSTDAQPLVEDWTTSPQPVPFVQCPPAPDVPDPAGETVVDVTVASTHESAAELAQALSMHGQGINDSQYDVAFSLFTPRMQEEMAGVATWRQGLLSTFWHELAVLDVTGTGDALTAQTLVRTSQASQDGPEGQTCSIWSLDYAMVRDGQRGIWLVDDVTMREDPQAC